MLSTFGALVLAASSAVALDATTATASPAYQVTICFRPGRNRLLTPLFVESGRGEVHDQLAILFGPLARVRVITSDHWLLDEFSGRSIDEPPLSPGLLVSHDVLDRVFLVGVEF